MYSVCSECGLPIKEGFSVRIKGGVHISALSVTMISGGKITLNYHKECVKEDESAWVRNGRGVVTSKGGFIVYRTLSGKGEMRVKR